MEAKALCGTFSPLTRPPSRTQPSILFKMETKNSILFPLKKLKTNLSLRSDYRRMGIIVDGLVKESDQMEETMEHELKRKRVAVFVSGGGSNFKSLHQAMIQDRIHGEVVVVVTDKPSCGGSEYAREKSIPVVSAPKSSSLPSGLPAVDLVNALREFKVDFLLLAGYLKLLPVELVRAYPRAILNIHPSLLPAFGGKGYYGIKVHKAVIASGARYSGATIHFVDEHYDTGRILAQRVVPVLVTDSPEELAARVLREEHKLYVEVVTALCEERIFWREDGVPFIKKRGHEDEYC
ncbi:Phosphoribosylglycinamide formyltransferase [Nymphaea thermarum]|nr:Phosphoribosylglycinamide formyltransferase [Nymphaea thermarum]